MNDLLSLNPSLPRGLTAASLGVYEPLFTGRAAGRSADRWRWGVPFGTLQSANVAAMSAWMLENHLIHAPISPERYGTNRFLAPECRALFFLPPSQVLFQVPGVPR